MTDSTHPIAVLQRASDSFRLAAERERGKLHDLETMHADIQKNIARLESAADEYDEQAEVLTTNAIISQMVKTEMAA